MVIMWLDNVKFHEAV
jgi:hypothetical protein